MPKDTKSSGYNKAPACESRGFGHKKEGENFDTPSRSNESSNHQSSAIVQPALPSLVPDGIGPAGFVGGPFGGRVGVFGSPVDTLGVRGYGERHDGKRKQKQQLPVVAGWGLLMYAAVSCFC